MPKPVSLKKKKWGKIRGKKWKKLQQRSQDYQKKGCGECRQTHIIKEKRK